MAPGSSSRSSRGRIRASRSRRRLARVCIPTGINASAARVGSTSTSRPATTGWRRIAWRRWCPPWSGIRSATRHTASSWSSTRTVHHWRTSGGWRACSAGAFPDLVDRAHVRKAPYDGLLCLLGEQVYYSITELLFRRSLFARIGQFESGWGSVSDFNWYMRVGLVANIVHVPDTWATWRVHAKQATDFDVLRTPEHQQKVEQMIEAALRVCEPQMDPAVVAGLHSRWLDQMRELRTYYRELGRRPSAVDRRVFQLAQILDASPRPCRGRRPPDWEDRSGRTRLPTRYGNGSNRSSSALSRRLIRPGLHSVQRLSAE